MTVNFYTSFSKRINSTKQPSSGATAHDCKLKENCSVHDPVLILSTNTFNYEYAYIATWEKYYFIVDCVSLANGLVEYHLTEDVLATYKTAIGTTSARIMYSSSSYDQYVIDPRIQMENVRSRSVKTTTPLSPVFSSSTGWYILQCMSSAIFAGNSGFSVSYILSDSGINKVRQWLADTNFLNQMYQYFHGRPIDSVFKVVWVPYDIDSTYVSGQTSVIIGDLKSSDFGYTFTTGECGLINGFPFLRNTFTITLDRRYTDFRRSEPYTTGQLNLPGVGLVDVCYADYKGTGQISILVTIEALTGNVTYQIGAQGDIVQVISTNVAAICPISGQSIDAPGVMNGISSFIGGAVTLAGSLATGGSGVGVAAGAGAILAGIGNTVLSANKHTQTISGSIGGRMVANNAWIYLTEYTVDTEDPADSDYVTLVGRPAKGVKTINTLSGYVQCIDASISGSMNGREKEEINTFLNSGFYYE